AAFSAAVLWIHWQLLLQHFVDSLETTCVTADNVVDEELGETHDLERAAREMAEVVRPANLSVEVLDGNGRAVRMGAHRSCARRPERPRRRRSTPTGNRGASPFAAARATASHTASPSERRSTRS